MVVGATPSDFASWRKLNAPAPPFSICVAAASAIFVLVIPARLPGFRFFLVNLSIATKRPPTEFLRQSYIDISEAASASAGRPLVGFPFVGLRRARRRRAASWSSNAGPLPADLSLFRPVSLPVIVCAAKCAKPRNLGRYFSWWRGNSGPQTSCSRRFSIFGVLGPAEFQESAARAGSERLGGEQPVRFRKRRGRTGRSTFF